MPGTCIRACTCAHPYQDKTYGKGMRVHNLMKDDRDAKCTVCGTKKSFSPDKEKK